MKVHVITLLTAVALVGGCASTKDAERDEQYLLPTQYPGEPGVVAGGESTLEADEEAYGGEEGKVRVVCRRERPTGSRIAKSRCYTVTQKKKDRAIGQEWLRNVQQNSRIPRP